jgi:transcriptional antiterminator RfaH
MVGVGTQWFAAGFKPNGYDLASHQLMRQGYDVFCPKLARHVKHARKTVRKLAPLFPGYMFVAVDTHTQRWRPIESTPGVTSLVKFGSEPARLPHGVVETLQAMSTDTGEMALLASDISIGDAVRVEGGAFDQWVGEVIKLTPPDRITLLIDLATRRVPITISAANAAVVTPAAECASPQTYRKRSAPCPR